MPEHPLIDRLCIEHGWPLLDTPRQVAVATTAPGVHCLFAPGAPGRSPESAGVAAMLPQLRATFAGRFDCAVVGDAMEETLRRAARGTRTPSLLFFRAGELIGAISGLRDTDDYIGRITRILTLSDATEPVGVGA